MAFRPLGFLLREHEHCFLCLLKKVDNLATQRLENRYLAEWRDAHQTV